MDELPHELVEVTDILLVNQHEVASCWGYRTAVDRSTEHECSERSRITALIAIIDAWCISSVVIENGRWHRISASQGVDTTGCGDSFMGTVLAGLAAGYATAAVRADRLYVSAYAATKIGAKLGTADEVIAYFS